MKTAFGTYLTSSIYVIFMVMSTMMATAGQPATLSISGEVRGADGMPKRFARVQLEGPGNYIAITNTRGEFSINNVQPGRYVATVAQGDNVQKLPVSIAQEASPVKITVKW